MRRKGRMGFCLIVAWWRHNERDGVSNNRCLDCLLKSLFRVRSKKTWKLRVTGLCEGNPPVTGGFPLQTASDAENVSIWWRHFKAAKPAPVSLQRSGTVIRLSVNGNADFKWKLCSHWLKCSGLFPVASNARAGPADTYASNNLTLCSMWELLGLLLNNKTGR